MGFWIFMLIMNLLIPLIMIGFGRYFLKKAPEKINMLFGYRSSASMKNRETWEFAHKYCGKIWFICGLVLLPLSVLFSLFTLGKSEDFAGTVGGISCIVQLVVLVGSIIPTEIALKKNFDENGNRR